MTSPEVTISEAAPLPPPRRKLMVAFGSVAMSAALIATSLLVVGARQVGERLARAEPRWLIAFFLVYVVQVGLLGLRWSLIARELGVPLRWPRASAEYALSIVINLLLPTGFAGDGWRALRHAGRVPSLGFPRIVEALALDRLSGQVAQLLVAIAGAPFAVRAGLASPLELLCAVGFLLATLVAASRWARQGSRGRGSAATLQAFLRRAASVLFAPRRAGPHLVLSLLLVGTHLVQLWLAARAAGIVLDVFLVCWLGPLISIASSVPSFFGSWGIREGASALLFASAGLPGSAGVAASLLVGTFSLVSALPGVAVMFFDAQGTHRKLGHAGQGVAALRGALVSRLRRSDGNSAAPDGARASKFPPDGGP